MHLPTIFLDQRYWACPGQSKFKLRGPNYLQNRKKVPAQPPILNLSAVELVRMAENTPHISQYLPCVRNSDAPFSLVVALTIPWGAQTLMLVLVFEAAYDPRSMPTQASLGVSPNGKIPSRGSSSDSDMVGPQPWELLLHEFVTGASQADDQDRNNKIKLIPSIVEGSWIVR